MGSGSSGKPDYHKNVRAVLVTFDNGITQEYRYQRGAGVVDWRNGEVMGVDISLTELADRAKSRGYEVETQTAAQVKKRDEEYKKERANRPDYELGVGVPWGNRDNTRAARRQRISDRMQKRGRRK